MPWKTEKAALKCAVIIPARDEEKALEQLIPEIPDWVDHVIVVNNGSGDATAKVARTLGADVIDCPVAGYGRACLAGMARADEHMADIIVFMDGDRSDFPDQMARLVAPIAQDQCHMVIGSRTIGNREKGALTPQQYFGNQLACALINLFWGHKYTDLGPFRAIRRQQLNALDMQELTFGWTVEMQLRAIQRGLLVKESAVDYRRRIGISKISGTVKGVLLAGYYILKTIIVAAWRDRGFQPAKLPAYTAAKHATDSSK